MTQAPRWQRRMRYRLVNSRRMRFTGLMIMLFLGMSALFILWFHGEPVAGIAVAASAIGASILLCFSLEILIHCPKLTEGLLFHLGILERVWDEEDTYCDAEETEAYRKQRRDRTVVLPKSKHHPQTRGYTFAVSEGTEHPHAQVEYFPVEEDLEAGGLDNEPVYYDSETGEYYSIQGDEGVEDEMEKKPIYGDVAPYVNTIDAKVMRVAQNAREGALQMMHRLTKTDTNTLRQDMEEQALLAEALQDQFPEMMMMMDPDDEGCEADDETLSLDEEGEEIEEDPSTLQDTTSPAAPSDQEDDPGDYDKQH